MILVSIATFTFLYCVAKKFPNYSRLKTVLLVIGFAILVSLLVSFVSVYCFYGLYDTDKIVVAGTRSNPNLAKFSLPFYFDQRFESLPLSTPYELSETLYFASVQLFELEYQISQTAWIHEGKLVLHPPGQPDVNYTRTLFYQLLLTLTTFNLFGAPFMVAVLWHLKKDESKIATHSLVRCIRN